MPFIQTKRNTTNLSILQRRIASGKSTMLLGERGTGKSRMLKELMDKYHDDKSIVYNISGLGSVSQLLGRMAGDPDIRVHRKQEYIDQLIARPRKIFQDEGQDMTKDIYPYLKMLIDAGNVFVIAGHDHLEEKMTRAKSRDVMRRFQMLQVKSLFKKELEDSGLFKDIAPDALQWLDNVAESTGVFMDTIEDCRHYAKEQQLKIIPLEIVQDIFNGEL
jgi:type II secretory pathway predicted ATPase ExeA